MLIFDSQNLIIVRAEISILRRALFQRCQLFFFNGWFQDLESRLAAVFRRHTCSTAFFLYFLASVKLISRLYDQLATTDMHITPVNLVLLRFENLVSLKVSRSNQSLDTLWMNARCFPDILHALIVRKATLRHLLQNRLI